MDELITWLRTQLDDDERVAREAEERDPSPWLYDPDDKGGYEGYEGRIYSPHASGLGFSVVNIESGVPSLGAVQHIARWDPARVLAEIEAKRRILDDYDIVVSAIRRVDDVDGNQLLYARRDARMSDIRWLAQPYAGRDGWREEWAA